MQARADIDDLSRLRTHFEAERVSGSIALFDSASERLGCSDVVGCQHPVIPASTFKIPNALIALETGVVEDTETLIRWDGVSRPIEAWNQDHTLRTALRESCVPCFQWIARSVGSARMQEWLDRLQYGNRDMSGGVDRFWLSGGLRIAAVQQIDFLRRLDGGKLPISERTLEMVRDILTLDVGDTHVLRGKTGLAYPPDIPGLAAWFVGWVEIGARRIFFATLIDAAAADVELIPVRRRLTERVLRAEGLLPD